MDNSIIKKIQDKVGVTADGIVGDKTLAAIAKHLGIDMTTADKIPSQSEVRSGRSVYGKVGDETNLVNLVPPYQLYFEGKPVKTIRLHRVIAERVRAALEDVLNAYGIEKIRELRLDQYSGSYNYRKTTTGTKYSMHAWGIALDWDAEHNAYSMRKGKALLSRPECDLWWDIWERHGAVSLGRNSNCDWMHLQFATFE